MIGLFAMERMGSKGLIDANFDSHPALKIWSGGSMFILMLRRLQTGEGQVMISAV